MLLQRDGTIHKEHRNVWGFGDYLNKVKMDDKEYYVRFIVERKKNESGMHSTFVTNVEVYDNPAAVAYQKSSNGQGRLDYDRIIDAKLKIYLKNARKMLKKSIKF